MKRWLLSNLVTDVNDLGSIAQLQAFVDTVGAASGNRGHQKTVLVQH